MLENKLITTYSSSHQNETNQLIHFVCVPVIFINVVAFLFYYLPQPVFYGLIFLSLIFYFRSLRPYLPPMIVLYLVAIGTCAIFAHYPYFIHFHIALFVVAWIGQFWGHKIEGKNPSFFENLFYLLVGPAWVMEKMKLKFAGKPNISR